MLSGSVDVSEPRVLSCVGQEGISVCCADYYQKQKNVLSVPLLIQFVRSGLRRGCSRSEVLLDSPLRSRSRSSLALPAVVVVSIICTYKRIAFQRTAAGCDNVFVSPPASVCAV